MIIVWTYDRAQQFFEYSGFQSVWTWIGSTATASTKKYIPMKKNKILYDHIFF